jgi:hypothetical protein
MNEQIETVDTEFRSFNKLARLNREIVITEKLDGSNAQILIVPGQVGEVITDPNVIAVSPDGSRMYAGSRNKWITPKADNYGFAGWCVRNYEELFKLGPGRHFGEWWGNGIQRRYGLAEKRFSLFNVARWNWCNATGLFQLVKDEVTGGFSTVAGPACCHVVPTLWRGPFDTEKIKETQLLLQGQGSAAAPGFMDPEGIVIFHTAANFCFKVTLANDDKPKSLV